MILPIMFVILSALSGFTTKKLASQDTLIFIFYNERPFNESGGNAEHGRVTDVINLAPAVGSNTRKLTNVLRNAMVKLNLLPLCNTDDSILETEQVFNMKRRTRIGIQP